MSPAATQQALYDEAHSTALDALREMHSIITRRSTWDGAYLYSTDRRTEAARAIAEILKAVKA